LHLLSGVAGSRRIRVRSKPRAEINFFSLEYKKNDLLCQWNNYPISLVSYRLVGGNYPQGKKLIYYALPCGTRFRSLANFVGNEARCMPGASSASSACAQYASGASFSPPRYPWKAKWYYNIYYEEPVTVLQRLSPKQPEHIDNHFFPACFFHQDAQI
jgi:hypothetical protein